MTEKTLKERLPVGSPRNKVEYLADEFERTANELYSLLENKAINLLSNPNFSEALPYYNPHGNTINFATGEKPDLSRDLEYGRGSALLAPYWGVELSPNEEQQHIQHRLQGKDDERFKPNMHPECGGLAILAKDSTTYQVLSMPVGGSAHRDVKARVSLVNLVPGTKITVGLMGYQSLRNQAKATDFNFHEFETAEHTDNHVWDTPKTYEFGPFNVNHSWERHEPAMVFYIRIENPTVKHALIESAQLWHSQIHGESPKSFVTTHTPNSYLDSTEFRLLEHMYDHPTELLDDNQVKFSRTVPIDAPSGLLNHMIFSAGGNPDFKVTAIDATSVIIQTSAERYQMYVDNRNLGLGRCQYSKMPIGLGFYE
ncbi:hypothetical protein ACQKPX_21760 [Photobacterium sp. DNB23_23_1]